MDSDSEDKFSLATSNTEIYQTASLTTNELRVFEENYEEQNIISVDSSAKSKPPSPLMEQRPATNPDDQRPDSSSRAQNQNEKEDIFKLDKYRNDLKMPNLPIVRRSSTDIQREIQALALELECSKEIGQVTRSKPTTPITYDSSKTSEIPVSSGVISLGKSGLYEVQKNDVPAIILLAETSNFKVPELLERVYKEEVKTPSKLEMPLDINQKLGSLLSDQKNILNDVLDATTRDKREFPTTSSVKSDELKQLIQKSKSNFQSIVSSPPVASSTSSSSDPNDPVKLALKYANDYIACLEFAKQHEDENHTEQVQKIQSEHNKKLSNVIMVFLEYLYQMKYNFENKTDEIEIEKTKKEFEVQKLESTYKDLLVKLDGASIENDRLIKQIASKDKAYKQLYNRYLTILRTNSNLKMELDDARNRFGLFIQDHQIELEKYDEQILIMMLEYVLKVCHIRNQLCSTEKTDANEVIKTKVKVLKRRSFDSKRESGLLNICPTNSDVSKKITDIIKSIGYSNDTNKVAAALQDQCCSKFEERIVKNSNMNNATKIISNSTKSMKKESKTSYVSDKMNAVKESTDKIKGKKKERKDEKALGSISTLRSSQERLKNKKECITAKAIKSNVRDASLGKKQSGTSKSARPKGDLVGLMKDIISGGKKKVTISNEALNKFESEKSKTPKSKTNISNKVASKKSSDTITSSSRTSSREVKVPPKAYPPPKANFNIRELRQKLMMYKKQYPSPKRPVVKKVPKTNDEASSSKDKKSAIKKKKSTESNQSKGSKIKFITKKVVTKTSAMNRLKKILKN